MILLFRYIPHPQIQWEFPDNYFATDARPFPKSSSRLSLSTPAASGSSKASQKSRARRRAKTPAEADKSLSEENSASSKESTESSAKTSQDKQLGASHREKNTKAEGQDKIG